MCTWRSLSVVRNHWYWALRSVYSVERMACVMPSWLSMTGQAKSYVGYIFQVVPVRWWADSTLTR